MLDFARGELKNIHKMVLNMAQKSLEAVNLAVCSIFERDTGKASEVIENDQVINEMMRDIDRNVIRVMALEQPVAKDLRFLFGVARLVTDLERIGDESYVIAERSLILKENPGFNVPDLLLELGKLTQNNMLGTLKMLEALDTSMARVLCDTIMNPVDLSRKVIMNLTEYSAETDCQVVGVVQLISMAYMLRRICEHCMNIGENIIFIMEGEDVRGLYQDRIKISV